MKPKTEEAISKAVNQVCGKVRQIVPQVVMLAGDDFTGKLTIEINMNCGGVPAKPRVAFEF